MATIVVAIASVVVSVVSLASQDGGPNMGSAPAPANYYQYDEDGNLTSAQTWNADKHAFESKENPEPSKPGVSIQGHSLTADEAKYTWSRASEEVTADKVKQWGDREYWNEDARQGYEEAVGEREVELSN